MPMLVRQYLLGPVLMAAVGLAFVALGCDSGGQTKWLSKKDKPETDEVDPTVEKDPREESAGVRDTVATVAWLEGMRRMSVGGYGLVVNLGKSGTTQVPRPIRDYMLQDMRRRYRLGSEAEALKHLSPEKLLDSEQTAVVTVYGEIPAAAKKGDTFDLTVRSLERTDVSSLEGGWLMPCSLKLWADGRPVEGRIMAEGRGQVFINPFGLKKDAATKTDPRVGRIIGGGSVKKARRLRLVLTDPSAAIANRLTLLINRRFGVEPYKPAEGQDAHVVDLRVPAKWERPTPHFLQLLLHLYVPSSPSFQDERLRELREEAVAPEAALADISLAWEGMGKTAFPSIRELYTHGSPAVSFFAARAGLRLGDVIALDVMARHAIKKKGSFRELAIEELGLVTDMPRVPSILRPLLDDDDQRIRQLAFRGLLNHHDRSIRSFEVGEKSGFVLDVVAAGGKFLISSQQIKQQRITLFGAGMRCTPPVFYWHRSETVAVTAEPGDKRLKLIRRLPVSGRLSSPIFCRPDVASLIMSLGREPRKNARGNYEGLGLTYSQVVEVLYDLCKAKAIPATFSLQVDEAPEILPEPQETGRPESEL